MPKTKTTPRTTPATTPKPERRYHPDDHCPAQKERTTRKIRRFVEP